MRPASISSTPTAARSRASRSQPNCAELSAPRDEAIVSTRLLGVPLLLNSIAHATLTECAHACDQTRVGAAAGSEPGCQRGVAVAPVERAGATQQHPIA